MNKESSLISQRWNEEYQKGRYDHAKPIRFITKIKDTLQKNQGDHTKGIGLYVGCGNGRNYIPLVDSGMNVLGIDISQVAIDELTQKIPRRSDKLACTDFLDFHSAKLLDYIIAIQVFQHGAEKTVARYFEKAFEMLKHGGLLFLRVNSESTQIYFKHSVIEHNSFGGLTVKYNEGPKKDLNTHFFSRKELEHVLCKNFQYLSKPHEDSASRLPPKTGTWSQWELVLKKK